MTMLPARTGVSDTYPNPTNGVARAAFGTIWDVLNESYQAAEVSVVAAATIDIGGQTSMKLLVTGTASITSLGTNYRGPVVVRFSGTPTLTHNATTLLLPNGANISVVAGDVAIFSPKSASGTVNGWQCVSYVPSTAAGARANLGLGTAAVLNVGTGANSVVQLDSFGKLPAIDGSALTGISSSGGGSSNADIFTGNGTQTTFTLSANPGALNNLDVAIAGVTQLPGTDYTWSAGTSLVFTSAPPLGAKILARYMQGLAQGTSDSASSAFIQAGTGAVSRTAQDKMREVVSVKDFGAVGDGITDDTAAIQAAINYANSVWSVVSGYNRGGVTIIIPAGAYRVSGLVLKNGASLKGAGRWQTVLLMTQNGGTMFKNASASSQLSADTVFWTEYADFSIYPDPVVTFTTNTVMWNMTGFSRCVWRNFGNVFRGNVISWQMTGATLAGSGGPSNWYNSFYEVFTEGVSTGGIGWDLGDTSATKEQITTWNWYGGRTSSQGSTGTGMRLNAATGCNLYGHVFEGLSDELIIGSAAGTRGCTSVGLFGCYFEGSANGYTIYPNAQDTVLIGCFATGVTDTDNGTRTNNINQGLMKFPVPNSANSYVLEQADASNKPQIKGSTQPGWRLNNSAGNWLDISNGAATSSASDYLRVDDVVGRTLLKAGAASAQIYATQFSIGNQSAVSIFIGSGTPEGAVASGVGSLFMRTDGGAGTSLYVKQSGTGNTGWVGK